MSLKRNILANYASQIYVTLIGIVMVPMYVRYMGAEAYGLVGFFAMLQAWFQLLDMGLTPTLARETARFTGGATDALSLRRLLRAMEGIFIGVAVLGATTMMAGSSAIASSWLKVQQLPLDEVQNAIMLMAVIVALRWMCGLYKGAVNGFERLVWLSGFNIAVATARFVLVIPFFIFVGTTPTHFFSYQLVLAVVETVVLIFKTYRLLPTVVDTARTPWSWASLHGVLKFSASIAFTSSVWVLVTQTDKLVLSKLLPLADYAYFTLAVLVASGVMVISGPISGVLIPRLTKLAAAGNEVELVHLYRSGTQLVCVIAIPAALILAFFAETILWAWTCDADMARKAAPVLTLYALGNGVLALSAFPSYLQFAKGDLKMHMIGNAFFIVILIPSLIWTTSQYGMTGPGYAWLLGNIVYLVVWVPKVHHHFMPFVHVKWLFEDIFPILFPTILSVIILYLIVDFSQNRLDVAIRIIFICFTLVTVSALSSSILRPFILKSVNRLVAIIL